MVSGHNISKTDLQPLMCVRVCVCVCKFVDVLKMNTRWYNVADITTPFAFVRAIVPYHSYLLIFCSQ